MENISYCHRPLAGVSVGAANVNGKLVIAASLLNDGTTRSGIWRRERHDQFCRATAHKIINGRINAAFEKPESEFTVVFDTSLNARTFMTRFRRNFKPTVNEEDNVLVDIGEINNIEYRIRKRADAIWDVIANYANEIVIEANKSESTWSGVCGC